MHVRTDVVVAVVVEADVEVAAVVVGLAVGSWHEPQRTGHASLRTAPRSDCSSHKVVSLFEHGLGGSTSPLHVGVVVVAVVVAVASSDPDAKPDPEGSLS